MRGTGTPESEGPGRAAALAPLLAILLFGGCGGGGGGAPAAPQDSGPAPWKRVAVKTLAVNGLTTPSLRAVVDATGRAHLSFFEASGDPDRPYRIEYLSWDVADASGPAPSAGEEVARVDSCGDLSLALTGGAAPLVLYQGGAERACNNNQSDAMLAVRAAAGWEEHTAATGFVRRNPTLPDGLAGSDLALAADAAGHLHAVYQVRYEGCDAMNFRYPELRYVRMDEAHPEGAVEETVEGNDYGGTNQQVSAGGHVAMALSGAGEPIVFYAARLSDGQQGLRVARRTGDTWVREWVEVGCEIGGVSAAAAPGDGEVAAAYQVTRYLDGRDSDHLLRLATRGASGWVPVTVDDRTRCGDDPSLAFDPQGRPAVAYRDVETYGGSPLRNLKLARFEGSAWSSEVVSTEGDVGLYNRLFIDPQGRFTVFTYCASDQTVYRFRR